jgi:hypothetical protein
MRTEKELWYLKENRKRTVTKGGTVKESKK